MINNRNGYNQEQDNLSVESVEDSIHIRPNTPIQFP
jgi:hypothetical protein